MPTDNIQPIRKNEYPADLLKFSAWREIVDSYETAVALVVKKRPVLGEPTVVPFYYTHEDGVKTVELVFGIGSMDPDHPYIGSSIELNIMNDAVIREIDPETGQPIFIKLGDLLKEFLLKSEAKDYIDEKVIEALSSGEIIKEITNRIIESGAVEDAVADKLRWKPFPIPKWSTI